MAEFDGAASADPALQRLEELQHAFQARVESADPTAPVPSCGSWTVRELAEHLGAVHLWAAGKVRGETLRDPAPAPPAQNQLRSAGQQSADRYRARAELLLQTLGSVPHDRPCQTLTGAGTTSFWQRRQLHETLIHLWDMCQALGSPMPPVPTEVWTDCVAEAVQVMHPRQIRLGRLPATEHSVLLVAVHTDCQWLLRGDGLGEPAAASATSGAGDPGSGEPVAGIPEEPAAVITGAAVELALLLWGRRSLDGLDLRGDRAAARALLAAALTP